MKRFVIILAILVLLGAGCASHSRGIRLEDESFVPVSSEPGYVQGFVDGYLSAFPDKPYRRENWSAHPTCSGGAYDQGWRSGYQIGKKDERQRP